MTSSPIYLTAKQVRERFAGISEMTLHRWRHNPAYGFPQPIKIGGRLFFKLSEIEEYEQRAAAARPQRATLSETAA